MRQMIRLPSNHNDYTVHLLLEDSDFAGMPQRFWNKIIVQPGTGCWEWDGGKNENGYGHFWWDGKTRRVHRVAYKQLVGEIPNGLVLDHLCRNRVCVRPTHLEAVTLKKNVERGGNANRDKTHCPHGHFLDGKTKYGSRYCKTCARKCSARRRTELRAQ